MATKEELETLVPTNKNSILDYLSALKKLLPFGDIWGFKIEEYANIYKDTIKETGNETYKDTIKETGNETYKDSSKINTGDGTAVQKFGRLLSCFAVEIFRFQERWFDLFRESIPGLSTELLPRWEKVAGLPNECTINYDDIPLEERQAYVHAKLYANNQKGLTEQFLLDYALAVGYEIEIIEDEFQKPFLVAPNGVDLFDIGSRVGDRLNDSGQFGTIVIKVISGDTSPDPYARFKCQVEKLKPSHVEIIWET